MCAIFALNDGELVEMRERPYESEADLQNHLAGYPELLSAEAAEDERRRWLLVQQEIGIADHERGADRWSLDHLLVDQDAVPTFVEVKRCSDTRIRREVVGQMLDYAANASVNWDAGRLRAGFESRFDDPQAANDELSAFLEGELEAEEFWETVAANLEERRLRLVFVADRIPAELRSIVEFLNEQLQLTEVIAVEIKQYVEPDGHRVSIAPRIIGETEMARRVKRTGGGSRRPRTTEEQLQAEIRESFEPEVARRMLALYEFARERATRQTFGRGRSPSTTMWMGEHEDPEIANPLAVWFGSDGVSVMMKNFWMRRSPEEMARLVALPRTLPGTADAVTDAVAKDYRTYCTFSVDAVLATDDDLAAFKRVLEEATVRRAVEA